eukprot:gene17536-26984_t
MIALRGDVYAYWAQPRAAGEALPLPRGRLIFFASSLFFECAPAFVVVPSKVQLLRSASGVNPTEVSWDPQSRGELAAGEVEAGNAPAAMRQRLLRASIISDGSWDEDNGGPLLASARCGAGPGFADGEGVEAYWECEDAWYKASIMRSRDNGTYDVLWEDGLSCSEGVSPDLIRRRDDADGDSAGALNNAPSPTKQRASTATSPADTQHTMPVDNDAKRKSLALTMEASTPTDGDRLSEAASSAKKHDVLDDTESGSPGPMATPKPYVPVSPHSAESGERVHHAMPDESCSLPTMVLPAGRQLQLQQQQRQEEEQSCASPSGSPILHREATVMVGSDVALDHTQSRSPGDSFKQRPPLTAGDPVIRPPSPDDFGIVISRSNSDSDSASKSDDDEATSRLNDDMWKDRISEAYRKTGEDFADLPMLMRQFDGRLPELHKQLQEGVEAEKGLSQAYQERQESNTRSKNQRDQAGSTRRRDASTPRNASLAAPSTPVNGALGGLGSPPAPMGGLSPRNMSFCPSPSSVLTPSRRYSISLKSPREAFELRAAAAEHRRIVEALKSEEKRSIFASASSFTRPRRPSEYRPTSKGREGFISASNIDPVWGTVKENSASRTADKPPPAVRLTPEEVVVEVAVEDRINENAKAFWDGEAARLKRKFKGRFESLPVSVPARCDTRADFGKLCHAFGASKEAEQPALSDQVVLFAGNGSWRKAVQMFYQVHQSSVLERGENTAYLDYFKGSEETLFKLLDSVYELGYEEKLASRTLKKVIAPPTKHVQKAPRVSKKVDLKQDSIEQIRRDSQEYWTTHGVRLQKKYQDSGMPPNVLPVKSKAEFEELCNNWSVLTEQELPETSYQVTSLAEKGSWVKAIHEFYMTHDQGVLNKSHYTTHLEIFKGKEPELMGWLNEYYGFHYPTMATDEDETDMEAIVIEEPEKPAAVGRTGRRTSNWSAPDDMIQLSREKTTFSLASDRSSSFASTTGVFDVDADSPPFRPKPPPQDGQSDVLQATLKEWLPKMVTLYTINGIDITNIDKTLTHAFHNPPPHQTGEQAVILFYQGEVDRYGKPDMSNAINCIVELYARYLPQSMGALPRELARYAGRERVLLDNLSDQFERDSSFSKQSSFPVGSPTTLGSPSVVGRRPSLPPVSPPRNRETIAAVLVVLAAALIACARDALSPPSPPLTPRSPVRTSIAARRKTLTSPKSGGSPPRESSQPNSPSSPSHFNLRLTADVALQTVERRSLAGSSAAAVQTDCGSAEPFDWAPFLHLEATIRAQMQRAENAEYLATVRACRLMVAEKDWLKRRDVIVRREQEKREAVETEQMVLST